VDKLLNHGEGWLETHPARTFITRRYFKNLPRLSRAALERLDALEHLDGGKNRDAGEAAPEEESSSQGGPVAEEEEKAAPLQALRLQAVLEVLRERQASRVIDLGCGEGDLLRLLWKASSHSTTAAGSHSIPFTRIAGMDVSASCLEIAAKRLKLETLPENQRERITLFQGSLVYRDKRLSGFDAAVMMEVLEHIDPNRLDALGDAVFGFARPPLLIATTPNREYNRRFPFLGDSRFRHPDHRFEWTREEFRSWAKGMAVRYGYEVKFRGIGEEDGEMGHPTLMGIWTMIIEAAR
jgi:3' terminal RNA ribose 2'-O-methyltransferase Hen1